ncbi:hypothetical protein [Mangrovicoccus ximenensis]|uniref:hypothetical protein n=1 Tax=Mangrovicoccus ximenensis TaxID=1911570 RepID=UPI001F2D439B|nr:hypothetical protein [Mangrovicoccus ximenensis]
MPGGLPRGDDFQQNYFVIPSFEDLLRTTVETDFAPLYAALKAKPDIPVAAIEPGDDVINELEGIMIRRVAAKGRCDGDACAHEKQNEREGTPQWETPRGGGRCPCCGQHEFCVSTGVERRPRIGVELPLRATFA